MFGFLHVTSHLLLVCGVLPLNCAWSPRAPCSSASNALGTGASHALGQFRLSCNVLCVRRSVISALSLRRLCIGSVFLCLLACECSLIKRASTFGPRLAACIYACRFRVFSLGGGFILPPPSFFVASLFSSLRFVLVCSVISCQDVPHS